MIVIAFDFGTRFIGVAVGNTTILSTQALPSLSAKEGEPRWEQVDKLFDEWRPRQIVVGLPLHMNGSPQRITRMAQAFAAALKERYGLPTETCDERLTTQEARDRLFEEGGFRALTKDAIDGESARLILEQWLTEGGDDESDFIL